MKEYHSLNINNGLCCCRAGTSAQAREVSLREPHQPTEAVTSPASAAHQAALTLCAESQGGIGALVATCARVVAAGAACGRHTRTMATASGRCVRRRPD